MKTRPRMRRQQLNGRFNRMMRIAVLMTVFAVIALTASAQDMGGSSSSSGTSEMMAPADSMSGAPAMKGSSDAMMAPQGSMKSSSDAMMMDMSYDTLKKEGRLADVKMGMQLRAAMSGGMKVAYKDLMSSEALAAKNPTVLFFSADWCPYCQADLKDINVNGAQLGKINVVVVDFDKSADIRQKYGITAQDTFVQIGPMGEKIAVWNGGGVMGILTNVKQRM
jgi:thiol-disulfide isomerase/thioredoxin